MNAQRKFSVDPKLLKRPQAEARYSMSWNTLLRAAGECRAIVRIGRSIWLNATILDAHFDSLSGTE